GRLQASQRADRALAWAIGGLDGFDKQMVGVGFTFVVPGCLPDIHWPLHIAVYTGAVNINCVYFSHYYRSFKTRTHKKRLGEDFPEMVQKSVEVGLDCVGEPLEIAVLNGQVVLLITDYDKTLCSTTATTVSITRASTDVP